ncbi:MazG nucleotide pyrophosphohydrolase domain-containing protein [Desulfogranum mediterraneum]|uniref:MazG nucleotide pyrophosphohydrolase domain-containing protein n=1 Tax=Desulfogranum mediterraneum TaxID=160661 RepID=UPI00042829B5|nr:MazG nucleotide pyrophosphohydrolase domain-containing protein [Desulfogranum mediterraneum]
MKTDQELSRLLDIVTTLRGDQGCPWDKKQTPLSMKKYLLEECRELAEALEKEQPQDICEEIGDLYFILAMLSVMYTEKQSFGPLDPLRSSCEKMIRRHPHVFADAVYSDEAELRSQWERIKKEEKSA